MQEQYENEQDTLKSEMRELSVQIEQINSRHSNTEYIRALAKEYPTVDGLTPEIVRKFIEKVIVSEAEQVDGKWKQRVRVIFNSIGEILLPGQRTVFVTDRRHYRTRATTPVENEISRIHLEEDSSEGTDY